MKNMLVNAEMTIGQVVDEHPAGAANVGFIIVFEMSDAPAEKTGGFAQFIPAQPAFFPMANLEQPLLVACPGETEAVQKRGSVFHQQQRNALASAVGVKPAAADSRRDALAINALAGCIIARSDMACGNPVIHIGVGGAQIVEADIQPAADIAAVALVEPCAENGGAEFAAEAVANQKEKAGFVPAHGRKSVFSPVIKPVVGQVQPVQAHALPAVGNAT